jgi:hypothetical protein
MTHRFVLIALLTVGLLAVGCESTPPTEPEVAELGQQPVTLTAMSVATRMPIAGSFDALSWEGIECRYTNGGVRQCRGGQANTVFGGDLVGPVVFTYQRISDKWLSGPEVFHQTAGGRVLGEVTWNSRTGPIEGTYSAQCQEVCSGTFVAHGSGDLAGVKFQIKWSGLWPMGYEGYALDPHGG